MAYKRKVAIHSHNFYAEGYLVGYSKKDGIIFAVIEHKGSITTYEIPSCYSIEFKE